MVVAVSGTPGTGKSVLSKPLARKIDATLIDLKALVERKEIYTSDEDGTKAVDVPAMRREFSRELKKSHNNIVVEGLLAHLLPKRQITHVIVLRTRPEALKQRLRDRKYSKEKIAENLDAEALDIILWEAVETHGADKVFEVDTTSTDVSEAVGLILQFVEGKAPPNPGKVDWLEEHFKLG